MGGCSATRSATKPAAFVEIHVLYKHVFIRIKCDICFKLKTISVVIYFTLTTTVLLCVIQNNNVGTFSD